MQCGLSRHWGLNVTVTVVFVMVSGGPAAAVSGAAEPGDQPALTGGNQPRRTEGLCPALPVTTGRLNHPEGGYL